MRNEKINRIRSQAQQLAKETGETVAIVQVSGCVYKIASLEESKNQNIKEYISADSS